MHPLNLAVHHDLPLQVFLVLPSSFGPVSLRLLELILGRLVQDRPRVARLLDLSFCIGSVRQNTRLKRLRLVHRVLHIRLLDLLTIVGHHVVLLSATGLFLGSLTPQVM
jgi:hypothetical protein